jgi:hypothetical protein
MPIGVTSNGVTLNEKAFDNSIWTEAFGRFEVPADAEVTQLVDSRTQVLPHTPKETLPEAGGRDPEFIVSEPSACRCTNPLSTTVPS